MPKFLPVFLFYVYWFTGFGLLMHGIVTLNPDSTLKGVGLFILAMVMVAYLIFGERDL